MKNFNRIFPTEIITDILSRLPTESLLECKLVCKTWKNLIQHPTFPRLQLSRLNSTDSGKLSYVCSKPNDIYDYYDRNKRIYYFEYNEDWNHVEPNDRKINIDIPLEAFIVIGSFNGLICIYGIQPNIRDALGPAIVFNPVTRECITLPEFDSFPEYETKGKNSIEYHLLACGFGYLVETDEYKVVRIYRKLSGGERNFVEVEVYTIGSGNGWRNVGEFDLGFRFFAYCEHIHGVFLNRCLHWRNTKGGQVVVFDLALEKFRDHIPPPPMLTDTDHGKYVNCFSVIGVSGCGILYYAVHQSVGEQEFNDVWLLVDKTEQIEHQLWDWSRATNLEPREPFAFMDRNTVVHLFQGTLRIFLPRTSTWESVRNDYISCQVFRYKPTLLSLKDLGEEDVEIMNSRGIENTDSSESGSDCGSD